MNILYHFFFCGAGVVLGPHCGTQASLIVACRLSCPMACGILVSWPEFKPVSPVLAGRFLITGPPGKSPCIISWFISKEEGLSGADFLLKPKHKPHKHAWRNKNSFNFQLQWLFGFSGSLAGKESACIAGVLGLIPGSGRSAGEGIGYPL